MAYGSITEFFHELSRYLPESFIENLIYFFYNRIGYSTVERLGYTASNTSQRIGVPAQRNRRSDCILEIG